MEAQQCAGCRIPSRASSCCGHSAGIASQPVCACCGGSKDLPCNLQPGCTRADAWGRFWAIPLQASHSFLSYRIAPLEGYEWPSMTPILEKEICGVSGPQKFTLKPTVQSLAWPLVGCVPLACFLSLLPCHRVPWKTTVIIWPGVVLRIRWGQHRDHAINGIYFWLALCLAYLSHLSLRVRFLVQEQHGNLNLERSNVSSVRTGGIRKNL